MADLAEAMKKAQEALDADLIERGQSHAGKADFHTLLCDCHELARRLAARLTATAEPGEGWRDIKTASKDWSNVLLYDPEEEQPVFEGFFSCKDGGRNRWIKGNILSVKPTHWQPLPAPPRPRTDSTEGATDGE